MDATEYDVKTSDALAVSPFECNGAPRLERNAQLSDLGVGQPRIRVNL